MPAAETCGMEDGEEDVHFAHGDRSSSGGFLGKIIGKIKGGHSNRVSDHFRLPLLRLGHIAQFIEP